MTRSTRLGILLSLLATQSCVDKKSHSKMAEAQGTDSIREVTVSVYESDAFNSESRLVDVKLQASFIRNAITNHEIQLNHLNEECDFSVLVDQPSPGWPVSCQMSLQTFYAVTKAISRFQALGFDVPLPIKINSQDPQGRCFATAGKDLNGNGGKMSVCPKNLDNPSQSPATISPIIFHEFSHIMQGEKMLKFFDSDWLFGFQEDHATLMAYMLSGQTIFEYTGGPDEEDLPQTNYDTNARFGLVPPGQYSSFVATTTFLIDLHRFLLKNSQPEKSANINGGMTKIYMNLFDFAGKNTNVKALIEHVLSQAKSEIFTLTTLSTNDLDDYAYSLLKARGLDLTQQDLAGYTSTISYNGSPFDFRLGSAMETPGFNTTTPSLSFRIQQPNPDLESRFPFEAILVPNNYWDFLGSCLASESENEAAGNFGAVFHRCVKQVSESFQPTNGTIENRTLVLEKPNEEKIINFRPNHECKGVDIVTVLLFDKDRSFSGDGNELFPFNIALGCPGQ